VKEMEQMISGEDTGILLEGGAMRSIFSAGVLDFFMVREYGYQMFWQSPRGLMPV